MEDLLRRFSTEQLGSADAPILAARVQVHLASHPGYAAAGDNLRSFLSSALPGVRAQMTALRPGDPASEQAFLQFFERLAAEAADPASSLLASAAAPESGAPGETQRVPRGKAMEEEVEEAAEQMVEVRQSPADGSSGSAAAGDVEMGSSRPVGTAFDDYMVSEHGTARLPLPGADAASSSSSSSSSSASASAAAPAPASSAAAASAVVPLANVREVEAHREEKEGALAFRVIRNDGSRRNMVWLTQVKNIFATQLPKMPREYIARLVFDRKHRSLVALKRDKVIGGISFRPFLPQGFAEIAFCAVTSSEQVRGYGTRLMNHLKEAVKLDSITHFLTYADNFAIGYFRKNGFSKTINMAPERWVGYIKDYDGGTLMECFVSTAVNYLGVPAMIRAQRERILASMELTSRAGVEYGGLTRFSSSSISSGSDGGGEPVVPPGTREAGWSVEELLGGSSAGGAAVAAARGAGAGAGAGSRGQGTSPTSAPNPAFKAALQRLNASLVQGEDSRPFRQPVDLVAIPDYTRKCPVPMGALGPPCTLHPHAQSLFTHSHHTSTLFFFLVSPYNSFPHPRPLPGC